MANALTGDFAAVLEVSAATIDRLLASMHQNPGSPHLPHEIFIRVGDSGAIDNVHGTVRAQVSAPRVELINDADDRVAFRFAVRVWYLSDPYRAPLPEFIYGEVRAEYGLIVRELPRSREHPRGGLYGYLGVIPGSVKFHSFGSDHSADAEITKQIDSLLTHNYVPSPAAVMEDVKNHRFRSLVQSAGAAVAHPLALDAAPPGGLITSVQQVFLGGKDFAVAVSSEFIMSVVQSALDTVKATPIPSVNVKVKGFGITIASATYTPQITAASADWAAGTVNLKLNGNAQSSGSWLLPDSVDFSVSQSLTLGFDPATESLTLTASGPPNVSASVSGVFGGLVRGKVKQTISSTWGSQITSVLTKLQPQLAAVTDQKFKLIAQLHSFDAAAGAKLEAAQFTSEGLILRGSISVSPRQPMTRAFDKLKGRAGYSAFNCWIPGGAVTEYLWRWELDVPPDPTFGKRDYTDRFLLLEDVQALPAVPPPPGSDLPLRSGSVCLVVKGITLDPVTGAEVAVVSSTVLGLEAECRQFMP